MNRMLTSSFSGTSILLFFFLNLPQTGMAEEVVPLLPMTVKGVTVVNSAPAPNGTLVKAFLDGQPVEELRINSSSGDYCFWISGNAADEGKPVTFTIDGKDTGNIVPWKSGNQVLSLDLSVGEGADPMNSIKGLNLKLNLKTLTEIGKLNAFGKNPETRTIESSLTKPDLKALEKISVNSGDEGLVKSSEGSSKVDSIFGFSIFLVISCIVGIVLGYNYREKLKRKC